MCFDLKKSFKKRLNNLTLPAKILIGDNRLTPKDVAGVGRLSGYAVRLGNTWEIERKAGTYGYGYSHKKGSSCSQMACNAFSLSANAHN